jgi:hypothetical protein
MRRIVAGSNTALGKCRGQRNKRQRGGFWRIGQHFFWTDKKSRVSAIQSGRSESGSVLMNLREILANLRQSLPAILMVAAVIAGGAVAIYLLPGRTAAVIIGVIVAAILSYYLSANFQRTTQIALLWLAVGVSADAAYAKINDQTPVTIATSLVRLAEAIIKLGDIVIRSLGVPLVADSRARTASVAPEFVWAFILALVFFLAFRLMRSED